ncbi:MAG: cation:proton antiporter [Desulfuromonadaceae bacterium]
MSTATLAPFHPMLYVGLLLLLSFLGGRIANRLRFPRVTGYLVAGILLGPSVAGVFPATVVQQDLGFITSMALAVIAFSIGGSLHLGRLKRVGGQILWVTLAEASGAFLLTTLVLTLGLPVIQGAGFFSLQQVKVYFPIALLIGSLCAATAPAAVLAIVHEYRSQGPLTVFLLGVLLRVILPLISRREALIGVALGGILLAGGLALSLNLPFLLTNMVLGFNVINFVGRHEELFTAVEGIEEPIFGMFFLLAGAHFDFNLMRLAGGLALLITLSRFLGKFLGVWCGARLCAAPAVVGRYLSLGLSPQAGVAVGLVLEAQILLGNTEIGDIVVSGVLGAVILNELLTPPFVRMALLKAKEAVLPP